MSLYSMRPGITAHSITELAAQGTLINPCRINVFYKEQHKGNEVCPGVYVMPLSSEKARCLVSFSDPSPLSR